jgi:2-formylbenzoate dehydrogenase
MHSSLADEFTERYVAAVSQVRMGLPWEQGVQLGPMVSERQRDRVEGFVSRAKHAGARVLAGGERPQDLDGYFVQPTVFGGVDRGLEIANEEIFGPVVSLLTFETDDEAIELANSVEYGLTGSIWTRSLDRAHLTARELDAGYIWVNDTSTHFPGVPFGGMKLSGIGREESLDELLSYTETKAVNVVFA